jgi:hypothetical protein
MHYDHIKHALYPATSDIEDFSHDRVQRVLDFVRGGQATGFSGSEGFEVFSRVQPHSPGLGRRMWLPLPTPLTCSDVVRHFKVLGRPDRGTTQPACRAWLSWVSHSFLYGT